MPLTPLPASNTKRYFIGNMAGNLHHEIQVRVTDAVTDGLAIGVFQSVFTALADACFQDTSFDTLSVALKGSDIRNPVAGWTPIDGTVAVNQPANDDPLTLCARGRSSDGRKVRMFLWGVSFTRPENWVLVPVTSTPLEQFPLNLNSGTNVWMSISEQQPAWKFDYTVSYNDNAVGRMKP